MNAFTLGTQAVETGGSLASSAMGMISQSRNRRFQERMSSTAHQREVKDLRKSGLNPILSAMGGSGASQPQGATMTPENPLAGITDKTLTAIMNKEQLKKIQAETNAVEKQALVSTAQQLKTIQETKILKANTPRAELTGTVFEKALQIQDKLFNHPKAKQISDERKRRGNKFKQSFEKVKSWFK